MPQMDKSLRKTSLATQCRPNKQTQSRVFKGTEGVFKLKCCKYVLILVVFITVQHFVGGNGPTNEHPDPIPADGSKPTHSRKPPAKRKLEFVLTEQVAKKQLLNEDTLNMYVQTLLSFNVRY